MAQGETSITVVGNLVADPELRFTPAGAAVANFRIASTPRRFNRQTSQWEDGEAMYLTCSGKRCRVPVKGHARHCAGSTAAALLRIP